MTDLSINWLLPDFTLQSFGFITSSGTTLWMMLPVRYITTFFVSEFLALRRLPLKLFLFFSFTANVSSLRNLIRSDLPRSSFSNFYYFISGSLTLFFHLHGIIAVSRLSRDLVLLIYFLLWPLVSGFSYFKHSANLAQFISKVWISKNNIMPLCYRLNWIWLS